MTKFENKSKPLCHIKIQKQHKQAKYCDLFVTCSMVSSKENRKNNKRSSKLGLYFFKTLKKKNKTMKFKTSFPLLFLIFSVTKQRVNSDCPNHKPKTNPKFLENYNKMNKTIT